MVLTLDEVKTHLRIELDDASQDVHLDRLINAAVDYGEQFLGRTLPWQDGQGVDVPVPESVKAGLLFVIADMYENREMTVIGTIVSGHPLAERMMHFYRVGLGA